jgi:c-di-GMP-binding flagellar brake protein YcgR
MENVQTTDRRRHYRVAVSLLGRYMLPSQNEYPCQVLNISPGGLALSTPTSAEIGDRVVVYVDHIGRIEGSVSRVFDGGFAILTHVSARKRERLAEQLTWLANRGILSAIEDRRHDRAEPPLSGSTLTLPDGREIECTMLDISVSGASVACSEIPPIGTQVILGRTRGRVVRHHAEGIAIEFDGQVDLAQRTGHFAPRRLIA